MIEVTTDEILKKTVELIKYHKQKNVNTHLMEISL